MGDDADREPCRTRVPGRTRRLLAVLSIVAVVVAIGLAAAGRGRVAPGDGDGASTEPAGEAAPPGLAQLDTSRAGGTPARRAGGLDGLAANRVGAAPSGAGAEAGKASGAAIAEFTARLPSAVDDRVTPASPAPPVLSRSYIVGRLDALGLRDPRSFGAREWRGVVRVQNEASAPSEAAEDTTDPAATAVRGRVVAEDGSPIPGATVVLWSCFYARQSFYDHRVSRIGRVVTGADGTFDVRPVALDTVHFGAGGQVLVSVSHPLYPSIVAQALAGVAAGRESDVGSLTLPARGVRVGGTIRDVAGRPVAGAVVRVSGLFDPVSCDKAERWVVLDECPATTTDAEGRYALPEFAPGVEELSVHVRLDCVHHARAPWPTDGDWSPRVQAGNAVRGRVVDPSGDPVAAAVVVGGGNWTPSNADGTFWLDNVAAGPLRLEVWHHAWHTLVVEGVATNGPDVALALQVRLSRVSLTVLDPGGTRVDLLAVDWSWPPGGGPSPFSPISRYWQDPRGRYALVVPEGATGATLSDSRGDSLTLSSSDLADGTSRTVSLSPPAPPTAPGR